MDTLLFKLIAIITMTFDHFGYYAYGTSSWMNYVGRLAFPIFAWQIVMGMIYTKKPKEYIFRIFALALISQPIFMLFLSQITQRISLNVLFTFFFGMIGIYIFKKNESAGVLATIVASILAQYLNCDYGSYGIIMMFIFYIFKDNKILMLSFQTLNMLMYYILGGSYVQAISLVSVLMTLLYNGKKGKDFKYLFYVFYPLHLFIIFILMILK